MLHGTLEPLVHTWGLWGLGADIFLEAMGLPLPGESFLVIAAGLAAGGTFDIRVVVLVAFLAATVGDNLGYLIGRFFGRPVVLRYGARFGITHERLLRVEEVLDRRGAIIVVIARFVVLLRQLNGLAAGVGGMHWARFAAANALGAALWVGTWATLAYRFGPQVEAALPALWHHVSRYAVPVVPVLAVALVLAWWRWGRRR
jgi:membrane protein DedA with SNARE-associated domain